jgi:DNA-binding MarR family transcriptional regulator
VDLGELCRRTGRDVGEIARAVARLELDGYLARVPGLGVRRL